MVNRRPSLPCLYLKTMKKVAFYLVVLLGFTDSMQIHAQDWEGVGYFQGNGILEIFPDTIANKLYVGGVFQSVDDVDSRNIICFNGSTFEQMTDSSNVNVCWNLGCRGVASIIRYQDKIIASLVRSTTYEANPQIIGVGAWDGTGWYPLDGGLADTYNDFVSQFRPASIYDFCLTGDTLYAAGFITHVDSIPALALGAWDGAQWHSFNVPEPTIPGVDFMLANSVAKYKGKIYLGGNLGLTLNGEYINDLIVYDGLLWEKVGDGLVDGLTNLHDMEVFQDKLYIAGYFTQADGNPGNSIMSWDGEQWNDLGGGVCGYGIIDDLFVHKDKLYVAGLFDCIGGIEAHNVAVWDGTKWCSVGHSIFNRAASAIAVWNDTIYAGGGFYEIDGQPVTYLARFVGDLSTSVCSEVVSALESTTSAAPYLNLYPNPAGNMLTITCSGMDRLLRYEVVDLLGRLQWSCVDCNDRQEVLVSNWSAGSYVVRAVGDSGIITKGFTKQ